MICIPNAIPKFPGSLLRFLLLALVPIDTHCTFFFRSTLPLRATDTFFLFWLICNFSISCWRTYHCFCCCCCCFFRSWSYSFCCCICCSCCWCVSLHCSSCIWCWFCFRAVCCCLLGKYRASSNRAVSHRRRVVFLYFSLLVSRSFASDLIRLLLLWCHACSFSIDSWYCLFVSRACSAICLSSKAFVQLSLVLLLLFLLLFYSVLLMVSVS